MLPTLWMQLTTFLHRTMLSLQETIMFEVSMALMEIRGSFDWKRFERYRGRDKLLQYARENLETLGKGTSRQAFILSNRFVLKVAMNAKGQAQNEAELDIFTNPEIAPFMTRIYKADIDGMNWLVADIVRPIESDEEFDKLTGVNFWDLADILEGHNRFKDLDDYRSVIEDRIGYTEADLEYFRDSGQENNVAHEEKVLAGLQKKLAAIDHPLVKALVNGIENFGMGYGDLVQMIHWGKTPDGRAVLLDYGLTDEIYDKYYA